MIQPVDRTFSARLDCHYRLLTPDVIDERTLLVVTLHGFGASPELMMRPTQRLFGTRPVMAALEGPYRFFRGTDTRDVGYGWITSQRPAESIRLHRDMVLHVLDEAGRQFDIPPERRILVGFSQAGALNYRFGVTCPQAIRGVIGICCGLPGEWDDSTARPMAPHALHIARRDDEYYRPEVTGRYAERLAKQFGDVEFHMIDGTHTMPSEGARIVTPWLERVLSQ